MKIPGGILVTALLARPCHEKPCTLGVSPVATPRQPAWPHPEQLPLPTVAKALNSLRGGGNEEYVDVAYGWCVNLGAPAALVAGAVVATLYENVRGGHLEVQPEDTRYVILSKQLTNMLLLSAFACQIISIFVTTVTGTMLLSQDLSHLESDKVTTGLGFLREHFEFEYLTSRVSFLQGLLNWLAGVALEHTIPRHHAGKAAQNMDRFVAASLTSLVLLLLSFYNAHMTYYDNYVAMVSRWIQVAGGRYFGQLRPLMILYVPTLALALYHGWQALVLGSKRENVLQAQHS